MIVGWRVVILFMTDSLFAALILIICTRVDVLLEAINFSMKEVNNSNSNELFKKAIEYHKKILRWILLLKFIYLHYDQELTFNLQI